MTVISQPSSRRRLMPFVAALIILLIQTAILGYMIESRASILRSGAELRLRTVPVDPRDLLRGDYVILSYDITTIPAERIVGARPTLAGAATLFVRLVPAEDGFWQVAEASFEPLAEKDGSVLVRSQPFPFYPADGSAPGPLRVDYGIERYYVPEGQGRVLEEARDERSLSVIVRVDKVGRMQIRQIIREGEPVYDEPLY